MKFGLADIELAEFHRLIVKPLKGFDAQVWVFGSRARGDWKPFSDIDVLYQGAVPMADISRIKEDIENSNFPFKVDLVSMGELAESYREQILHERQKV